MCKVLGIAPSSYHEWTKCDSSCQQIHLNQCELLVRITHSETKHRYSLDLQADLADQGCNISQYMVRRIKKEYGIACHRHKRFKFTTNSNHNKLD